MGEAVFKQRNGMLAVNIAASCGVMTPDQFVGLGQLAQKMNVAALKLTSRQTVVAILPQDKAGDFISSLPDHGLRIASYGNAVRSVKACAGGDGLCPRSLVGLKGEALDLGMEIQNKFMGQPVPKDFKIALAGCARGCTDPYCADFGVVASGSDLFDLYIGGRGGSPKPGHGVVIACKVPREKVIDILEFILDRFRELGHPGERLCQCISRLGLQVLLPSSQMLQPGEEQQVNEFAGFLRSGK